MAANPVLQEILRQGRNQPRRHVAAALETARVESNFTNPQGGDADSAGWRQERRSLYPDPTNLQASVSRFFQEAAQHDRGQPSYQLAADVQRPRADLRGRYRQAHGEALGILAGRQDVGTAGSPAGSTFTPGRVDLSQQTTFDQAGFEQAKRRAAVGAFLARRHGTGGILFKSGLLSTTTPSEQDFTTTSLRSRVIPGSFDGAPASGDIGSAISAAAKRLGVSEVGHNRGGRIDKWEQRFGMIGQPWCGIFLGVALQKAGVRGITSRVASVDAIEQDARRGTGGFQSWHGAKDARPGDALVTAKGQHVGLVERVDRAKGLVYTIEGNAGTGAVERRSHPIGSVYGVARPNYRR